MDEIQKVLMKAGRKDLAQKYYLKVAAFTPKDHDPYYDISSALELNTGTELKQLKDLLKKEKVRANPDTYQLMLDLSPAKAKEIANWITKNKLRTK